MTRAILWDFDRTLARREGMWSGCLVDALEDVRPGHGHARESFRPYLSDGFPWHAHETPHPELCEPDAWWAHVEMLLANAYRGVGLDDESATAAAARVRIVYGDHTRAWALFDDVIPALQALRDAGWRHGILSNHVPELPALVAGLGLDDFVAVIVNSATIGYEKPHPEAFAEARRALGAPSELWMVGDNPVADVAGAEAAGIRAILVRHDGAPGLAAVVRRLNALREHDN